MRVGQSKTHSFAEAIINVLVGCGISLATQLVVFPAFGIRIPIGDNLKIVLIFTVVSIARSYSLRRAFNWWHLRN